MEQATTEAMTKEILKLTKGYISKIELWNTEVESGTNDTTPETKTNTWTKPSESV